MDQKKSIYLLIGIIVVLSIVAFFANQHRAETIGTPPTATGLAYLYRFEDFPAERYEGTVADVDFSTAEGAQKFKTVISGAVAGEANFAGRYVIAEWGCGTSCQDHAIVDLATGKVVRYGLLSAHGLEFTADSRLLIVNSPQSAENAPGDGVVTDYYELRDGTLVFLAKQMSGEAEGVLCAQVVTEAKNPTTGKTEEFGSPCSVPFGWEILR